MKKFFLIPLMACSFCAMAFAADVHVSTYADLKNAVEKGSATTIYLDQDIEYRATANNTCINITRNLTIDGQGHTLTGYAGRNNSTNGTLIALNHASTPNTYSIDVTIKNFNIIDEKFRAIETRSNVGSLTIENCLIKATGTGNYQQPLTIGGNQSSAANINIINSEIVAKIYYPIITFNPVNLTITDSRIDGWCSVYFKGPDGSAGAHGSTVVATNSYFNAQNYNHGLTNTFGAFVLEDDDVDIELDNCVVDVTAHDGTGVATQALFLLSDWATDPSLQCRMTIKGSNSHVIGDFILDDWDASVPVELELQGGSYYGDDFETAIAYDQVSIASGYHAEALVQDGHNMYRIIKDAATKEVEIVDPDDPEKTITVEVLYDLNDLVEGEGEAEGNNPVSSFELSSGGTLELDNETTTAGYVQVQDNVSVDPDTQEEVTTPTVIQVGKTETNEQTGEEEKVDQTLVVNNGLDIQGESQVVVQAGSTLIIGNGGVVTENSNNIVLEANEEEAVNFLLDPEITVNTTPIATYKFKSKAKKVGDVYTWQRFGIPTFDGKTTMSWDNSVLTALFEFNYSKNGWDRIYLGNGPVEVEGIPFQCYDMTNGSETEIEYTFTGKLMGNVDAKFDFEKGWNYYANCYTAPVDLKSFIGDLMEKYGDNEADKQIAATIYLFDREDLEGWTPITWAQLRRSSYAGPKDIKPMQAFIMQLTKGDKTEDGINYRDNVFDPLVNPSAAGAPARVKEDEFNAVDIVVSNGVKNDKMTLFEEPTLSEAFDNGWDAEKFEDNGVFSLYRESDGKKWQDYGSNDLSDQFITFETKEAGEYTMTFSGVDGEVMNLYDAVADKLIEMKEGAEYKFTSDAIKDAERFQINPKAPTGIDEVDSLAPRTTKFIGQDGQLYIRRAGNVYTVQGQNIK